MLDAAETLGTCGYRRETGSRIWPGTGAGQHSIQVNQQWRICLRWTDAGPADAEITDYH